MFEAHNWNRNGWADHIHLHPKYGKQTESSQPTLSCAATTDHKHSTQSECLFARILLNTEKIGYRHGGLLLLHPTLTRAAVIIHTASRSSPFALSLTSSKSRYLSCARPHMTSFLLALALWAIVAVNSAAGAELHTQAADSSVLATPTFPFYSSYAGKPYTVDYDKRSLRLNDEPVLFMSGSIHYPRSTPAMWPVLMNAAREDGINMIEIYVFWNGHEPVEGQLDWSGRYNLTLFLDAISQAGLFANLRIGPYVCAEWDYGGIPVWLSFKEGIRMRSYNQVWRDAVQKWVGTVIDQVTHTDTAHTALTRVRLPTLPT